MRANEARAAGDEKIHAATLTMGKETVEGVGGLQPISLLADDLNLSSHCRAVSGKPINCLASFEAHLKTCKDIILLCPRRGVWQDKINYLINIGEGALKLRILLVVYRLSEPLNDRSDRRARLNKLPNVIFSV